METPYNMRGCFIRLFLYLLISALSFSAAARDIDEIKRSGKIIIAFTENDLEGLNFKLAEEFARYLNVELEVVEIEWQEVFEINGRVPSDVTSNPEVSYTPDLFNRVDLICSTFSILEWRKKLFDFAETLYSAELIMINEEDEAPRNLDELAGKKIAFMQENMHLQGDVTRMRKALLRDMLAVCDEHKELVDEAFAHFYFVRSEVDLYQDTYASLQFLNQHYPLAALTNGNADLSQIFRFL